jgi:hypothetical protein
MKGLKITKKMTEDPLGMLPVEIQIINEMPAGNTAGCATARKLRTCLPLPCFDDLVFEKTDGQKSNLLNGGNGFRLAIKIPQVVAENRVIFGLKMKQLERNILKVTFVYLYQRLRKTFECLQVLINLQINKGRKCN